MNARPKRKPIKWPDGACIAITPCVAFETWPEDLGGPFSQQQQNRRGWPKNATTKKDLSVITDREFGERVGIYRFLDILEQEKTQTSSFPNRITDTKHPDNCTQIGAQGDESC